MKITVSKQNWEEFQKGTTYVLYTIQPESQVKTFENMKIPIIELEIEEIPKK